MYHQPSQRTSYPSHSHHYSQSRPPGYGAAAPAGGPYPPQQMQHRPSQSTHAAGVPDQARLWQWFCQVDTDRSGEISVNELHAALINGAHRVRVRTPGRDG